MIHIIPGVKVLEETNGFLKKAAVFYDKTGCSNGKAGAGKICDSGTVEDKVCELGEEAQQKNVFCDARIASAMEKLPYDPDGARLAISVTENEEAACFEQGSNREAYELWIREDSIEIKAESFAGAFYGIQTLRQTLKQAPVPCLYIKDWPDFEYRGFYHDVTRGKVPTVDTIKALIDQMVYYKLNSLQLYVEHTFEFKEFKELNEKTGYLTGEELREIDRYCQENFVEFIPSLSTFGHLYELLEMEEYKHLRVLKDFEKVPNFWVSRMRHHTIDPRQEESLEVIKSLIDQYMPYFDSEIFNICCDETFDLNVLEKEGYDVGRLYIDFVKKIIQYLKQKNKKVMMWADILLHHPETIGELPEDIYFLNWNYEPDPSEENIIRFAQMNRQQIVCPGTTTWNRFCENVDVEEKNICLTAEYGHKHGALGVLNTNWGDCGNPCSLDLAMYGLVLGAEKSWAPETKLDDAFYEKVNHLLYENEHGIAYLKELSHLHDQIDWMELCDNYFAYRTWKEKCGAEKDEFNRKIIGKVAEDEWDSGSKLQLQPVVKSSVEEIQSSYVSLRDKLLGEEWVQTEYQKEMLLGAEGVCVIAELSAKLAGNPVNRVTDTREWLRRYREAWMRKSKESELYKIEEMFLYCEEN